MRALGGATLARCAAMAVGLAVSFAGALPGHAQPAESYPAQIQEGSCADLGPVAFELTAVGAGVNAAGTPVPAVEIVGAEDAAPIAMSETTVQTTLSQLVADDHAIVVDAAGTNDTILARGPIGGALGMQMAGMVMPGDELAVGLAAADGAGYAGMALIRAAGTEATVPIFLFAEKASQ